MDGWIEGWMNGLVYEVDKRMHKQIVEDKKNKNSMNNELFNI